MWIFSCVLLNFIVIFINGGANAHILIRPAEGGTEKEAQIISAGGIITHQAPYPWIPSSFLRM